jgi:hypothetical protein
MASPIHARQVEQTQQDHQGPQRAEGGRVPLHPRVALRQGRLGIFIGELQAGQPVLQVLPGIYAVL